MARMKIPALLLLTICTCAGCSAFFGFNAFSTLDIAPKPALADFQGANGLSTLATDLGSPAVVDQLKSDPKLVDDVKTYLETTYLSAPLTTADQQTAAALYADLSLATTSGDTLVNNVVTTIMSAPPTGNLSSIITSIIPPAVLSDTTGQAFDAMVQGLLDANNAYELLGNSIPTYGVPPGTNIGDVAQKAAVACMMRAVVDAVKASGVPDDATAEQQMFKLVTNDPTTTIASVSLTTDPLSSPPTYLVNIYNAAGAPLPA